MISALRQQGVARLLEDSSGNGGAAIAAYAAAGGHASRRSSFPPSTQPAKTVQMRAYGAEVELVPGPRQATSDEAIRQSAAIFYASHNWQPFFLQGTKTLAYELWEDLGFRAPDNVVIPTGAGSNVLGCDIGFGELLRRGEIARLPRLFAAQPENCAPLRSRLRRGRRNLLAVRRPPDDRGGDRDRGAGAPARGSGRAASLRRRRGRGVRRGDHRGEPQARGRRALCRADQRGRRRGPLGAAAPGRNRAAGDDSGRVDRRRPQGDADLERVDRAAGEFAPIAPSGAKTGGGRIVAHRAVKIADRLLALRD